MNLTLQSRFESALQTENYAGLIDLVHQFQAQGINQTEVYDLFRQFMLHLRETEREKNENKVTDVMDFIAGWCSPHQCLFAAYLTNEEIETYDKSK
jgi:hypothetical protein